MKKNNDDESLDELLKLLRKHPELIKELVFEPTQINRLLHGKAARRMALGEDATRFLKYVAGPSDGYPIAQCFGQTNQLCAKGTKHELCGGGTRA